MNEIVVTGYGPVSSIGIGKDAFLSNLCKGDSSGISPLTLFNGDHRTAEVTGLDLDAILPSQKTYLDRASEFALAAGQLALTNAAVSAGSFDKRRVGIVLGSEFGCLGTMQTYSTALQQKGARLANPLLFSHMYINTPTSLCAIEFGLGGFHASFAGAGAGTQALECATDALLLGRADMILAIGVDALSEAMYRALVADGSIGEDAIGEGACAVVLESRRHALERGKTTADFAMPRDVMRLRPRIGRTFAAEPFFALVAEVLAPSQESTV